MRRALGQALCWALAVVSIVFWVVVAAFLLTDPQPRPEAAYYLDAYSYVEDAGQYEHPYDGFTGWP